MITIRLQRHGRKNDPSFRIIVVDSKKKPKTGNYLEMVGFYDARTNRVELKGDRIKDWMAHGATVSDTVHNLLVSQKVLDAKKINVLPRKTPPVKAPENKDTAAIDSATDEVSLEKITPPEASNAEEPHEENTVAAEETIG